MACPNCECQACVWERSQVETALPDGCRPAEPVIEVEMRMPPLEALRRAQEAAYRLGAAPIPHFEPDADEPHIREG